MTDTVQRDIAEIERQRDAFARLDRIGGVERDLAVLRTRFEAAFESFLKELERSVSGEDLKELKREWEMALRDAMNSVSELVKTANDQQSANIIGRVELMLAHQQERAAEENKRTRQEIIRYGVGFALTILSALLIFWFTERM
jgi:hypothetical protein